MAYLIDLRTPHTGSFTGSFSGSVTGALLGTGSWANSASFVSGAYTAQWALSSSFVSGAYTAQWAPLAQTASFVSGAYTAQWAKIADTASFVSGAYTAQWALSASTATSITFTPVSASYALTASAANNFFVGGPMTGSNVTLTGQLTAQTKSFLIKHRKLKNKQLMYGVLEGPEHAVYCRGKVIGDTIMLPVEWEWLVDLKSITVQLTPVGKHQKLYVREVNQYSVIIGNSGFGTHIEAYYLIYATRKDVPPLQTVV